MLNEKQTVFDRETSTFHTNSPVANAVEMSKERRMRGKTATDLRGETKTTTKKERRKLNEGEGNKQRITNEQSREKKLVDINHLR